MNWIHAARNRDRLRALVNTLIMLLSPQMKTVCSHEKFIAIYKSTLRHGPRDHNGHLHGRENIKSQV
jgi:hypothetical protein